MNDPEIEAIEQIVAMMDHILIDYHLAQLTEEEMFNGLTQRALELLQILTSPVGQAASIFTAN